MRRQSRTGHAVTHCAVHKHCYLLTCGPTQQLRASPLIVALLLDRTDVINEGVGRVITGRGASHPANGCRHGGKDAVPDDDD